MGVRIFYLEKQKGEQYERNKILLLFFYHGLTALKETEIPEFPDQTIRTVRIRRALKHTGIADFLYRQKICKEVKYRW